MPDCASPAPAPPPPPATNSGTTPPARIAPVGWPLAPVPSVFTPPASPTTSSRLSPGVTANVVAIMPPSPPVPPLAGSAPPSAPYASTETEVTPAGTAKV